MSQQDNNEQEPSFEDLLNASDNTPGDMEVRPGDTVGGVIVLIASEQVFIDWGGKGEGWADASEFMDEDGKLTVSVGDSIELKVLEFGRNGAHLGTKFSSSSSSAGMHMLDEAHELEMPIEGVVKSTNKGGFEVEFAGAMAFCPISQIDINYCEDPEVFVNTTHLFKVIEFDEEDRKIVVSRRAYLEEIKAEQAKETRESLEVDAVFKGIVRKLMPYGAFVDFGGLDGFVHISEIDHEHVNDPADYLSEGKEVEVKVISITEDQKKRERIGLSIKALIVDPWTLELPFKTGDTVKGTVKRIQPFGAFVEVSKGIDGLLHISEIALEHIESPEDVLKVDEEIEILIKDLDLENRRITLSRRALLVKEVVEKTDKDSDKDQKRSGDVIRRRKHIEEDVSDKDKKEPAKELSSDEAWSEVTVSKETDEDGEEKSKARVPKLGLKTKGIVRTLMPYGIFLDLPDFGDKASGLLHNSEIDSKSSDPQKGINEGDSLEVEIIRIDETGRLSLSQKAIAIRHEREEVEQYQKKSEKQAKMGTFGDIFGKIKLDKK